MTISMIWQYVIYLVLKTALVGSIRDGSLRPEVLDEAFKRGEGLMACILPKRRGWGKVGYFNRDVGHKDSACEGGFRTSWAFCANGGSQPPGSLHVSHQRTVPCVRECPVVTPRGLLTSHAARGHCLVHSERRDCRGRCCREKVQARFSPYTVLRRTVELVWLSVAKMV